GGLRDEPPGTGHPGPGGPQPAEHARPRRGGGPRGGGVTCSGVTCSGVTCCDVTCSAGARNGGDPFGGGLGVVLSWPPAGEPGRPGARIAWGKIGGATWALRRTRSSYGCCTPNTAMPCTGTRCACAAATGSGPRILSRRRCCAPGDIRRGSTPNVA